MMSVGPGDGETKKHPKLVSGLIVGAAVTVGAGGIWAAVKDAPLAVVALIIGAGTAGVVYEVFKPRWPAISVVVLTALVAGAVGVVPQLDGEGKGTSRLSVNDQPDDDREPQRKWPFVLDDSASEAMLARNYLFILHDNGDIRALRLANPFVGDEFRVPGTPKDVAFCAKALLVTYERRGRALVRRIDFDDGRKLAEYHYGTEAGQVVCDGDRAWLNKRGEATAVSVEATSLEDADLVENPSASESTYIAIVGGDLWMADAVGGRVDRLDLSTPAHQITEYEVMADPRALLHVADRMFVLHPKRECLMWIDESDGGEVADGVRLFREPRGMIESGRSLYVFHHADPKILEVDGDAGEATKGPIELGENDRIADLEIDDDGNMYALDDSGRPRTIRVTERQLEGDERQGEPPGDCDGGGVR